MPNFNPNCIVGHAVLYKRLPANEVDACIGNGYNSAIYSPTQKSSLHVVCYDQLPNIGHSPSQVANAEKYFTDEELKPFIESTSGHGKTIKID